MSKSLSATVARVGRALLPPDLTDGQLVGRFVRSRDGDAFAALVRRHGPMVLAVCRRVAGDHHLADDAFQATFLVLARRAADVTPREAVRAWLYGVAVRTAREARSMSARRRSREVPVVAVPDRAAFAEPSADADALRALDEEIARLPEHLRAAVVLCELDGLNRKDAAARLGVPEGTLSSRLAKARKVLAGRLHGRGVVLPVAGFAVLFERSASAAGVPAELADAAAGLAGSGPVPAVVAELSHGVFRTMLLKKLSLATVGAALLIATVWGTAELAARVSRADEPSPTKSAATQPQNPKPAGPGRLLVWKGEGFVFVTPDGKEGDRLPGRADKLILNEPVIAPDGKRVAFTVTDDPPADAEGFRRRKVFVRGLDGRDPGRMFPINALGVFWAPAGRGLYAIESLPGKDAKDRILQACLVDPATGEKKPINLPSHVEPFAVTPDDKAFVGTEFDVSALPRKVYSLALIPRDGSDVTRLTGIRTKTPSPRVSPDGTRILFQDPDPRDDAEPDGQSLHRLYVYDRATKTRTRFAEVPPNALIVGCCWSPDGKKVAYTWRPIRPGLSLPHYTESPNDPKLKTETDSFLVIADWDGKNPKTVLSGKAGAAATTSIGTVDWR